MEDLFFIEGHGREVIQSIRIIPVTSLKSEQFAKYESISVVYEITTDTHHVKEDKYTTDTRYYIGSRGVERFTPHEAITYIRGHWSQESYHWVKDVVLREDACTHKNHSGSRTLGVLRTAVAKIGKTIFGSVKTFVDHFSANPKKFLK